MCKAYYPLATAGIFPSKLSLALIALPSSLIDVPPSIWIFAHGRTGSSKPDCSRVSRCVTKTDRKDYLTSCVDTIWCAKHALFLCSGAVLGPFCMKPIHLLFPASSSLFALTLRGTLAGLGGPSLTLLGSLNLAR